MRARDPGPSSKCLLRFGSVRKRAIAPFWYPAPSIRPDADRTATSLSMRWHGLNEAGVNSASYGKASPIRARWRVPPDCPSWRGNRTPRRHTRRRWRRSGRRTTVVLRPIRQSGRSHLARAATGNCRGSQSWRRCHAHQPRPAHSRGAQTGRAGVRHRDSPRSPAARSPSAQTAGNGGEDQDGREPSRRAGRQVDVHGQPAAFRHPDIKRAWPPDRTLRRPRREVCRRRPPPRGTVAVGVRHWDRCARLSGTSGRT